MHLKIGTKVKVVHYDSLFNGRTGKVIARDGEYYTIKLSDMILHDIYLCKLEEIT